MSFFDVIDRLASQNGSVVAAVDAAAGAGAKLTYAELRERALRVAAQLAARLLQEPPGGVQEEQPVATLMRRGLDWYCVYCAAARLQVPLVAMSNDLQDAQAQDRRNREIASDQRPQVLVVEDAGPGDCFGIPVVVRFGELLGPSALAHTLRGRPPRADATLCLCYTGGTTKAARCARVTHRMALHEVEAYPRICRRRLGPKDRVLQQHSVYWAAATFGEIDVAVAFGCAVVFAEGQDAQGIAASITANAVTFAGLLPSFMALLDPKELPSLRVVFAWGEALPACVANAWAKSVYLLDVLISTECWLSFYADWSDNRMRTSEDAPARFFKEAPGVCVWLHPTEASSNGSLELRVSGPMVSPGYTNPDFDADMFCRDEAGTIWYCTRDCVRRHHGGGFTFVGRADDLVKVGGAWVDVGEVERDLEKVGSGVEVRIYGQKAFVALSKPLDDDTLPRLRRSLPPGFAPVLLPALPRHPATGKVDRQRCLQVGGSPDLARRRRLENEARLCAQELKGMVPWYLPLAPVALRALFIFMFSSTNLAHRACVAVFHILWRLAGLSFILSLALFPPDFAGRWRWWFPFTSCAPAVFLSTMLPDPTRFGVLAWLPFCAPGLYLHRGRLLTWPVVCLLGFPYWAKQKDRSRLSSCALLISRCLLHLGLRKQCHSCPALVTNSGGHADAGGEFYCAACWAWYGRHRECTECWVSSMNGYELASGWVCSRCDEQNAGYDYERTIDVPQNSGAGSGGSAKRRRPSVGSSADVDDAFAREEEGGGGGEPEGADLARPPAWKRSRCRLDGGRGSGCQGAPDDSEGGDGGPDADGMCLDTDAAPAQPEPRTAHTMASSSSSSAPKKCNVWQAIEKAVGLEFSSLSDPISSLDSLRVTKLVSALHRHRGVQLPSSTARSCTTLGELLEAVAQCPAEARELAHVADNASGEHRSWGMMWATQSKWLLWRDRPLTEDVFSSAVRELMRRHAALRAAPCVPMSCFTHAQQALTLMLLWRGCGGAGAGGRDRRPTLGGLLLRVLGRAAQRALWSAWPRIRVRPDVPAELPVLVLPHRSDRDAARDEVRAATWWTPPLHVTLAPYGEGAEAGALVRFKVTHMFSDGYSFLPLLSDFAALVDCLERGGRPAQDPPLPPVPNMFALLEQRILRTIEGDDSRHDMITPEELKHLRYSGAKCDHEMQFATLTAGAVDVIKHAARRLMVSDEVAMLTILGITFVHFDECETRSIVMVAPQRDEPGAVDMIGFFADFRQLDISTDGLSFAGVALRLQHIVKEREWFAPSVFERYDFPFVNFEWTLFEAKSGFTQVGDHTKPRTGMQHPYVVNVDEPNAHQWRMRIGIDRGRYSAGQRHKFLDIFEWALQRLACGPHELAWAG